ncbi:hypothetical protein ACFZDJ_22515 [Streptomyces sp. NPDC007896]
MCSHYKAQSWIGTGENKPVGGERIARSGELPQPGASLEDLIKQRSL